MCSFCNGSAYTHLYRVFVLFLLFFQSLWKLERNLRLSVFPFKHIWAKSELLSCETVVLLTKAVRRVNSGGEEAECTTDSLL